MKLLFLLTLILPAFSYSNDHWSKSILSDVETLYNPFVKSMGQTIEFKLYQSSDSEAASADTDGTHHVVLAAEGLFSNLQLRPDGFRIILCHELGHIFGGAPRKNIPYEWTGPFADDGYSFLSSEGQADFYATASCFRNLIKGQRHQNFLREVSPEIVMKCDSVWGKKSTDSAICQRASLGAENFLKLNRDFDISFGKTDLSIAPKLLRDEYPDRQCRLDTFLRGALCKSSRGLKFDFVNPTLNDCQEPEGQRPRCWYK
jgi:hypothetical protein